MFRLSGHATALRLTRGTATALLGASMLIGTTSHAASAATPSTPPATLFERAPKSDWAALNRAAARNGSVRVIVLMSPETRREDSLRKSARLQQRALIANKRDHILNVDLSHRTRHGLKVSNEMPLMAFDATLDDLARLRKSADVRAVTIDREIKVDLGKASGRGGRTAPTPAGAKAPRAGNAAAGTVSNGSNSQLTGWWDWYRLGVDKTTAAGWNGSGQTVAIVDSGVDRTHTWLKNKVVLEACFSGRAPSGALAAGGCPNGTNMQSGVGAAAPCTFSLDCAHGTHTAHTAAGQWGVAPAANIIAIQVFHRGADGAMTYFESDVVWALSYVYGQRNVYNIAAINLSIGSLAAYIGACDVGPNDGSTNATYLAGWIDALKAVQIATVIATGNGNYSTGVSRPACIRNAVAVGNTTYDANGNDAVYGYVPNGSNSGALVDLLAPGTDICSAVPLWADQGPTSDGTLDGFDCRWIGTSMAAPHVTGALAVLRQKRPAASVDSLVQALQNTGVSVRDDRNGLVRTRISVLGALNGI